MDSTFEREIRKVEAPDNVKVKDVVVEPRKQFEDYITPFDSDFEPDQEY